MHRGKKIIGEISKAIAKFQTAVSNCSYKGRKIIKVSTEILDIAAILKFPRSIVISLLRRNRISNNIRNETDALYQWVYVHLLFGVYY